MVVQNKDGGGQPKMNLHITTDERETNNTNLYEPFTVGVGPNYVKE
jgi:hypothetical protein